MLPIAILAFGQVAKAEMEVTQITAENATKYVQTGPSAVGGIGDWHISNGTLCAIVSDVDHEGAFSTKGGSLVDLGFCGRADDQYSFSHDLLAGSRRNPFNAVAIAPERRADSVSLTVTSHAVGARLRTTYSLKASEPTQLHIQKTLHATGEGDFAFFTPIDFNFRSRIPFVLNSKQLERSIGFANVDFVERGTSAIGTAAQTADTIISIGPHSEENGIAYGWHLKSAQRVESGQSSAVPAFMLADHGSNAMLIMADSFYLGDNTSLSLLKAAQIPLLSLGKQAHLTVNETIFVGQRADVASITDQLFSDGVQVSGKVNLLDSGLHIQQPNGRPVTFVRPKADGTFTFRVPAGKYRALLVASANRQLTFEFETDKHQPVNLGNLHLPKAGRLDLPLGKAMRLVFIGKDGTPNPNFVHTHTQASIDYGKGPVYATAINQVFLAGVAGDTDSVDLPAGSYQVYATAGPEYSLETTHINVINGKTQSLKIGTPKRVIDTPGYIASDLHVHSGQSFDNTFAESDRVRTFVAEHGEVMVSSEHDKPTDFKPWIRALGLDHVITSINAAEMTSMLPSEQLPFTGGHANFFPFDPSPHEFGRGMVKHEDQRLRDIIRSIREQQPDALIQLNHPRANLTLSENELPDDVHQHIDYGNYFDHLGAAAHPYNPNQPLHHHPNNVLLERDEHTGIRDLDFDLLEVFNPGGDIENQRLQAVRRDWLSLLKQGERKIATANSDSHHAGEQVAVPRTMVKVTDDRVPHFKQNEFISSLKSGNAYGTTGPMLEVSLNGAQLGETFTGSRGTLKVVVKRAPWVPASELRIQVNGETIDRHTLQDQLEQTIQIPIQFSKDSFVTLEVLSHAQGQYADIYPGITPYAFSNPIYVDYDSDGKWLAPGL